MNAAPVVARPWGVPLRVHWTFLLLALLPVAPIWPARAPGPALRLALVALLAASVLFHEAAHVGIACRVGVQPLEVVFYPFGGVTRFVRPLMPGRTEALIALAGPAASLCLAAILYALGRIAGGSRLLEAGAVGNVALAAGNLIPAWPLDGGRIARSLLASRLGSGRATRLTGLAGQLLGLLVTLAGLRSNAVWIIPGVILFLGASSELHRLSLETFAGGLSVRDAMLPTPILAPGSTSIEDLRELSRRSPGREILLVQQDRPVAYLPAARMWSAAASPSPSPLELSEALGPEVEAHTPAVEAVHVLERSGERVAPVVAEGRIVGVVTLDALRRAVGLAERLARMPQG